MIKIYPIASGKVSKSEKNNVVALVLEDGTSKNEKTNLYESASVMAPETVTFWVSKEICGTLSIMKPVDVIADVSIRGEYLNTRVKKIMHKGTFVDVSDNLDETTASDK